MSNIEDIKKEYENRFVVIHIGDKQISGVFSGYASGDPILEHFGRDAQDIIWNFFESKLNQTAEEAVQEFVEFSWDGSEHDSWIIAKADEFKERRK